MLAHEVFLFIWCLAVDGGRPAGRYAKSTFFVCVVLFKRQLLYFIKSFYLCQELFYFSLSLFSSFPLLSHATAYLGYHFQNSLSTTFLIYFLIISLIFKSLSFLPIKNVPPPRLLSSSVPLLFSLLFLSDEGYLIEAPNSLVAKSSSFFA